MGIKFTLSPGAQAAVIQCHGGALTPPRREGSLHTQKRWDQWLQSQQSQMFSCSTHPLGKLSRLRGVRWDRCSVTASPLLAAVKQSREEAGWNNSFEIFEVIRKFSKPELSSTISTKWKIQFNMRHCLGLVWFILYPQYFSGQFINSSLTWQVKQVLLNLMKRKYVREKQTNKPIPNTSTHRETKIIHTKQTMTKQHPNKPSNSRYKSRDLSGEKHYPNTMSGFLVLSFNKLPFWKLINNPNHKGFYGHNCQFGVSFLNKQ